MEKKTLLQEIEIVQEKETRNESEEKSIESCQNSFYQSRQAIDQAKKISKFTKKKFDKVFIYEVSPMLQALPGVWYAKRKKIDSYIYVMDLWPESPTVVGPCSP